MLEDTQGTPLHTGNMAIQHTSSLYTTYILPCFKARFLIVLKPHRTCLLIATLRGKQIGWLKSKIHFCLYFLFFSLVSMYCKYCLLCVRPWATHGLLSGPLCRQECSGKSQGGSGVGEISKIARALLATIRTLGFILAIESNESL